MKLKVTQYGYPNDECGDTLTEQGWGFRDNKLNEKSCALTVSAQRLLGVKAFQPIKIDFGNGLVLIRNFDDRAPQGEPRVDLYMPKGMNKSLPDYAMVSVLN